MARFPRRNIPRPRCSFAIVTALLACMGAAVTGHQSYNVCAIYQCSCNDGNSSLTCRDGHDFNLRSLLQLPRTYQSIAIDGFVVVEVLAGHELSAFRDLRHLSLTHCRIDHVDDTAFSGLAELEILSLSGNHISSMGAKTLAGAHLSLRNLDLSFNLLKELDRGLFDGLENLAVLNLSHNKLRALQHDALDWLQQLRVLDLSFNELLYIFPKTFAPLRSLQWLNLQKNLLVTAQEGLVTGKPSLRTVLFGGNRFECNCGLSWLRDRLVNKSAANRWPAPGETSSTPGAGATLLLPRSGMPLPLVDELPAVCAADGVPLAGKTDTDLLCSQPVIESVSAPVETFQRSAFRLSCNVSGAPQPAIVWRLPSGDYLADPMHGEWLHDSVHGFFASRKYYITATADELTFTLVPDAEHRGCELEVNSLRRFTEGVYTCIAMNPMGNVSAEVVVTMVAPIGGTYIPSLMFGAGATSAGTLLAGMFGCLIQRACTSRRKRRHRKASSQRASLLSSTGSGLVTSSAPDGCIAVAALSTEACPLRHPKAMDSDEDSEEGECEEDEGAENQGDDYGSEDEAENYDAFAIGHMEGSPRRYGNATSPHESSPARSSAARTKETLGAVKVKLRSRVDKMDNMKVKLKMNMEKKAEHVKVQMEKRAERMRTNMEKHRERMRGTLLNIRESTSHSLQSIRDTSSSYAHKLHVGMRNAMENVGYTVQSLKELCGAGDLGLTMSVATIATNVDTDEQVEVIRNVTLV